MAEEKPDAAADDAEEKNQQQPEETSAGESTTETTSKPKFSPAKWLKENPKAAKIGLVAVLLIVAVIIVLFSTGIIGGCGKKKKKRPPPPPPPAAVQPQSQPQSQPADVAQPPAQEEKETPKEETKPEEEEPKRPDDFADWTADDFKAARAEGDSKLKEAVAYLAKGAELKNVADPVALLGELLAPPQPDQDHPDKPIKPGPSKAGNLIEPIVTALGSYESQQARTVLERLLRGDQPSEDDKTAAFAALSVLAKDPCPGENQKILFEALTAPQDLRPADKGDVTAEQLQAETLKLVPPIASDTFRLELAKKLIQRTTPSDERELLGKFIKEDDPRNLGAQFVLYQYDKTPDAEKDGFEKYFVQCSSQAMCRVLGIVAEEKAIGRVTAPRAGQPKADPDLPFHLGQQLWSAAFVEPCLAGVESLEKQGQILVLAGTIPVDSTRAMLLQALNRCWNDGAKGPQTLGLARPDVIGDPCLPVVLKSLLKSNGPTSSDSKEQREKQEKIADQWRKVLEDLIDLWCERFLATALARKQQAERNRGDLEAGRPLIPLRIKLRSPDNVVARYQAFWSRDIKAKLPGVKLGPMQVDYVRIEEKADSRMVLAYYRRQAQVKRGDERSVKNEKGTWLDGFFVVPQTTRKRSVDVRITVADKKAEYTPGEPVDLVTEILVIEMNDPGEE